MIEVVPLSPENELPAAERLRQLVLAEWPDRAAIDRLTGATIAKGKFVKSGLRSAPAAENPPHWPCWPNTSRGFAKNACSCSRAITRLVEKNERMASSTTRRSMRPSS
jgi:hypothetical protein